jgi:cobyrinic acid a,c-diamide synthase
VQTFKVGPDYLDPSYLALASGRPCYNLDGWMMGQAYVQRLFASATADADVAVIEGVMGLFDGADPASPEGSTAEIASWLGAPVLLVVDVHGMSRSLAALVHGFTTFDPQIWVAGIIANRCGSERHRQWLADALRAASLPPLIGAVQRGSLPELPRRHLGLVTASANAASSATLDRLADKIAQAIDLAQVLPLSRRSRESRPPALPTNRRARLGIARDEAFHFYYPDNLCELERLGCELVPFSPIHDRALPEKVDGLYFGGGYPEEYAEALSANPSMLESIRAFARRGVVYAECGGLMYLSEGIETLDGKKYPQLGLLPGWTRMRPRRQSLGYVEVTLSRDCLWGERGQSLRGHEFHYSELVPVPGWESAYDVRYRRSDRVSREGFCCGPILASYTHLHFASRPGAAESFVRSLEQI